MLESDFLFRGFSLICDSYIMSWVEYDGVPPLYDGDDPSRMTAFAALGRSVGGQ